MKFLAFRATGQGLGRKVPGEAAPVGGSSTRRKAQQPRVQRWLLRRTKQRQRRRTQASVRTLGGGDMEGVFGELCWGRGPWGKAGVR